MALPFIDLWICEPRRGYLLTSDGVRSLNADEEELFQPKLLWTVLACASALSMAVSGYAYGVLNSLPWCYCSPWLKRRQRRPIVDDDSHGTSDGDEHRRRRRRRRRSSAPGATATVAAAADSNWDSTQETSPQYHHVRHQIFLTLTAWLACIALLTAAVLVIINTTKFFRSAHPMQEGQNDDNDDRNDEYDGPITQIFTGQENVSSSAKSSPPPFTSLTSLIGDESRLFSDVLHKLTVSKLLAVKTALVVSELCFLSYLFWRLCHAVSIYLLFQQRQIPFIFYVLAAVVVPCIIKTLDVTLLYNSFFAFRPRRRHDIMLGDETGSNSGAVVPTCSTTPAQTLVRSTAYAVLLLSVAVLEYALHLRTLQAIKNIFTAVAAVNIEDERPNFAAAPRFDYEPTEETEYARECLRGMRNKLRVIRLCFLVCWAPLAVLNLLAALVYYLYYYYSSSHHFFDSNVWWWNTLIDVMVGMSYFCAVMRPFQLLFDAFAYWDSAVPPPPAAYDVRTVSPDVPIITNNMTNFRQQSLFPNTTTTTIDYYDGCTLYSSSANSLLDNINHPVPYQASPFANAVVEVAAESPVAVNLEPHTQQLQQQSLSERRQQLRDAFAQRLLLQTQQQHQQ